MVLGKNRVQKKRISVGDFFLKRWKTLGGKTHNKNTKKAKNPQILLNWKKAKKTTSLRHPPGWLHLMCGVWTWLKKIGFTQLHPVVSIIRAWSAHHPTRASRAAASGEGMGKKKRTRLQCENERWEPCVVQCTFHVMPRTLRFMYMLSRYSYSRGKGLHSLPPSTLAPRPWNSSSTSKIQHKKWKPPGDSYFLDFFSDWSWSDENINFQVPKKDQIFSLNALCHV